MPRCLRQWLILSSLLIVAGFISYRVVADDPTILTAYIRLRTRPSHLPWRTLREVHVRSGSTVPADTNVIVYIPFEQERISREILFGRQGKNIRYWGYCFPDDSTVTKAESLPGKIFLSEAERAFREAKRLQSFKPFSIFNIPTEEEMAMRQSAPDTRIRHQIDSFRGGMTCYVMTERSLPIGTDLDADGLNSKLEETYKTDPDIADTDSDGVSDGKEIFNLGTDPTRRDTDSDGLIDGIEDWNHNGRIDSAPNPADSSGSYDEQTGLRTYGDTDPLQKDSDADGLCDGFCRVGGLGRTCADFAHTSSCDSTSGSNWRGEDKNLNGILDDGETDPTMDDSDNDGILDEQEYFNCLIEGGKDC